MCTRPDTCASVPIVPSQKENRLLTFKRSSHQCLISLGGCMLLIASILTPHGSSTEREGLGVGRGDILILGLWDWKQKGFCKSLSRKALGLIGWFSTPTPPPPRMHFLSILRLHFISVPFTSASFQGGKIHLLWPRSC